MGKLIYSALLSLDGYVADEQGNFDWAAPDVEVHSFVNDLVRSIGTYLYGRRMYEVMAAWETLGLSDSDPAVIKDFATIWRAAEKVVYSSTLETVASARTRIERRFAPDAIGAMKANATDDIGIGGPHLAAEAIRAGLVDEYHLFVVPHIVGGGNRALPEGVRAALDLIDERRFDSGTVYLHFRSA